MVRAPAWLSSSIIRAWASRDHGQAPISARLRSSMSTIRIEASAGRDVGAGQDVVEHVVQPLGRQDGEATMIRLASTASSSHDSSRPARRTAWRRVGRLKCHLPICSVCSGPSFSVTAPPLKRVRPRARHRSRAAGRSGSPAAPTGRAGRRPDLGVSIPRRTAGSGNCARRRRPRSSGTGTCGACPRGCRWARRRPGCRGRGRSCSRPGSLPARRRPARSGGRNRCRWRSRRSRRSGAGEVASAKMSTKPASRDSCRR
jgi:hypothetical protein